MLQGRGLRRPDPILLRDLRERILRLEGGVPERVEAAGVLALDVPKIDDALPWGGLPRAVLHEVIAGGPGGVEGAASGFAAALLAGFAGGQGVLWCRRGRDLYGPGLAPFGLDCARLIVVSGHTETDILWAMEEGLRSGSLGAVLGEIDGARPPPLRRLQLAARAGGTTALLLRPERARAASSPALTRWRVSPAPGKRDGGAPREVGWDAPRWRVELVRCRNGTPGSWLVEWRDGMSGDGTPGGFIVVSDVCDRSAGAEPARHLARPRRLG